VVGLVLTGFAIYKIAKIRSVFMMTARIPELVKDLSDHVRLLNTYLYDYNDNSSSFSEELARSGGTLRSIRKIASRPASKIAASVLKMAGRYTKSVQFQSEDTARNIYYRLVELENILNNLWKDLKWR
jgi:hypothetical protein